VQILPTPGRVSLLQLHSACTSQLCSSSASGSSSRVLSVCVHGAEDAVQWPALLVLDRAHPAPPHSDPLPQRDGVRAVVEGQEVSEQRAQEVAPHYAVVAFSAAALADLSRRLVSSKVLVPTSFKSSAASRLTLGLFPTAAQVEDGKSEDDMRSMLVPHAPPQNLPHARQQLERVFAYLDAEHARLQHAAAPDKFPALTGEQQEVLKSNPVKAQACIRNAMPSMLRKGVLPPAAAAAAQSASSFFTPRPAAGSDLAVQDDWKHDARSLHHLVPPARQLSGVYEAALFFKVANGVFFPLHDEQCGMHFTHHQQTGEAFWFMLHVGQEGAIRQMVEHLVFTRSRAGEVQGQSPISAEDERAGAAGDIAWALYHAKGIMPTPALLGQFHIAYDVAHVSAGQAITGRGPHFGVGVGEATTVSFASNQMDEQWLFSGVQHMERFFVWLQRLAAMGEGKRERLMQQLGVTRADMAQALHQHPPDFTCALLQALQQDHTDKHQPLHRHTATCALIKNLAARCGEMQAQLHAATPLLRDLYVDQYDDCQLCACEQPEYASHAHARISAHMYMHAHGCICAECG
jgi:hypothetical protein